MPFTFAHPAIVIPIKEKWKKHFCLTGLALGSMAPDFEYFIKFKPDAEIGHSLFGFVLLNLPLCLVIAYLFHKVIKKPFISCMPSPLDRWLYHIAKKDWKINSFYGLIVFIYSSLIGMASHVFWDAFTHETGRFVEMFSILSRDIGIAGYLMPVYKILQHGSTVLGFAAINAYIFILRDKNASTNRISTFRKFIFFSSIIFSAFSFIIAGILLSKIDISFSDRGTAVVTFINGGIIGCIFMCMLYNINIRKRIKTNKSNKSINQ